MSWRSRLAWGAAVAGTLLAWSMDAGGLRGLPAPLRAGLAFALLVWLPGMGWARAIGARPAGGRALVASWATGYGVAWLGLLVLATRAVGVPFTALTHAGVVWAAVPWLVSLATAPRLPKQPSGPGAAGHEPRAGAYAAIAIALAAVLAVAYVARHGPGITYLSDTPDHLGTIRRMVASGDPFPRDAFFRDAGAAGVDPRKGLWHPCVALVCALSRVDPVVTWHVLAAVLAGMFVVTAAGFAHRLGGPLAAAAGAWGTLLGYGGGLGTPYLSEAVFATKLADQFSLATAAALLLHLEDGRARSRVAVIALALGTIATHVFGAIQFTVAFGALGLGLVVRDRAWSQPLRRLVVTSAACALAALPYLAWRALGAYAPVNPIHTETQGMLEVARGVRIVSVGAMWDWLGPLWVLFPLSLVWWWRAVREPAVLYLLTTTLAVATLMFVPPVVALLEPRLGYLLMRLPWLLPVGPAVAFLVARARAAWSGGRRWAAFAPAALLVLALAGPLVDAAHAFTRGASPLESLAGMRPWTDALAWMDRGLPQGTVVLSDPATSYSIPAFTRHWVTCLADQHSSPNDPLALARILDARDALDPCAPWSRTRAVVTRWGATAIALNGRFPEPPVLDYWAPATDWYDAARARLERAPQAFERVYEHDRFSVYIVHRQALAGLEDGGAPRAYLRAFVPGETVRRLGRGLPELVSFRMNRRSAAHGDTLAGRIEWHAATRLVPGVYRAGLRFDRPLPPGVPRAPEALSKTWRKLVERVRHERYRFRADHLPTSGDYGVDCWAPGEVVQDTFRLSIPPDVAPGEYEVKLSMLHQPHYPNFALRDLLSDDDLYNGLPVGRLRVVGPGALTMCGINGVFWYRGGQADAEVARAQARAQRHRGPDDADVWAEGPVALGHRRLAVVDLSPGGHQPMANEDGSVHVTYNGELYNFPEVLPELAKRGHRFRGRSDTEMLLHLWEEKGPELVHELRGMFTFGLYDSRRRTLMLARDRAGKKPLYWHDDGRRIVFASELKALLADPSVPRDVDPAGIADYLTFQYVPAPGCILRGIRKLPAAHRLICDERGPRVERYWELPFETDRTLSEADAVEGLRERLREAVRVRLMSDVPLGAFLSGGIDSSAVVALMTQVSSTRVKTYSIGFEEEDYSELGHARAVAEHLGTDHHELVVQPRALELLPRLVWGLDEPFADASMLPTFHVSEMARSHVTVALSGDGGDEAFAGYTTYQWARSYARLDAVPRVLRRLGGIPGGWLPSDHPLGRRLRRAGMSVVERHLEVMSHFPPRELRSLLTPALREATAAHDPWAAARAVHARAARCLGDVAALPALDALTYMTDDVLVKVDRTSMMNSLETRAPLLDHHVLEWVARMPFGYKLRGDTTKWALRECVKPWLPPAILARGKQGFGVPLERWFDGSFGRLAREVLLDRRARDRGWIDPRTVQALLVDERMRKELQAKRTFTLVCLELWARTYLDRPRAELAAPTDGPYPLHPAVAATAKD